MQMKIKALFSVTLLSSQLAYLQSSLDKLGEAIKLAKVHLWGLLLFCCCPVVLFTPGFSRLSRVSPRACRRP